MQALILAGGEGTRLRPLTAAVPKPVVTLVDRPFIAFMLEWLRSHGVDDVIMSCGFLASGVRDVLGDGAAYDMRIHYVEEPEPLGTGGALKFAEELLDERFFMLNGDVLTDMDLSRQLAQHERTGASGTLALVAVPDPSSYGLVRVEGEVVQEFLEKPSADQAAMVNTINAGAYVLERSVLDLLEYGKRASIERDVFPRLVGNGLHATVFESDYWMDIGTPERYLQGSYDILEGTVATRVGERLATGAFIADDVDGQGRVVGPSIVESGCVIGPEAQIGGRAVLGEDVEVGHGSIVQDAVILEGAVIGEGCSVVGAVIGPGARIGDGTTVSGQAIIGAGVHVGAGNTVTHGARLFPGVAIPDGSLLF